MKLPFDGSHETLCVKSSRLSLKVASVSSLDVSTFAAGGECNDSFTHEAMEKNMVDGRHLEMGNLFPFQDDSFSMSISQLKEKILPAADPEPYWFWRAIDEKRISWRDLNGGALQHFME